MLHDRCKMQKQAKKEFLSLEPQSKPIFEVLNGVSK